MKLVLINKYIELFKKYNSCSEIEISSLEKENVLDFLSFSSKPEVLNSLEPNERNDWAELTFKLIRIHSVGVLDMFAMRHKENPEQILFKDLGIKPAQIYTFDKVYLYTREVAAALTHYGGDTPVVGIFAENSIATASVDLACLFYGILVSPLNISFKEAEIVDIIEQIKINIFVTDTKERYALLCKIRDKYELDFKIFISKGKTSISDKDQHLDAYIRKMDSKTIENIVAARVPFAINEVATVMFTSGSTGRPKGLCFSNYNLVTKRFARGAAIPYLGNEESLLCYLPLFHTFGRYLEKLGAIYWDATYHFAGNTSSDTLIKLFPEVNPSIFISVPLRWNQLYEKAEELMQSCNNREEKEVAFRSVVGSRLKWGLSAAGYLEPKVFMFFRNYGVDLCSGFGMTEATGGVTMTPPEEYIPESVGKPLPGIELKLGEQDELFLKGHYIAKYLDDVKPGEIIPYPQNDEFWLPTGDVFKVIAGGHYRIVDRIKDIYKNNRGQTVAPKIVENKFTGVPGIKSVFLVGDGLPYNTLIIVPDNDDEFITKSDTQSVNEYYSRIISEANRDIANYEKVINYAVSDREFSAEKGELTAKGSFNRKTITENFGELIKSLYKSNKVKLEVANVKVIIPKWIFSNLSILENEIIATNDGLLNTKSGKILEIREMQTNYPTEFKHILIGNLVYITRKPEIDLGVFSKQPKLWFGNPQIMKFLPCRTAWDQPVDKLETHSILPENTLKINSIQELEFNLSPDISELNDLICTALYHSDVNESLKSIEKLSFTLENTNENHKELIRKRLESLANHSEEEVRCSAYKVMLLDEPTPNYSETFPAFLTSGKSFLNANSIKEIASGKLEKRRLEALRKRLYTYRKQLKFPLNDNMRRQLEQVFGLLLKFIEHNPEYYTSVRYEFISWILLKDDPKLSQIANYYFKELSSIYESNLEKEVNPVENEIWMKKLSFDDFLEPIEREKLLKVFIGTAFLKQSVLLAYEENNFDISKVKDQGLWITRYDSGHSCNQYRISIDMKDGGHYEFQIILEEADTSKNLEIIYHHVAIAGYPFGSKVLPKLGAYRPELKARSMLYQSDLTVWDNIRELNGLRVAGKPFTKNLQLRRLIVESITAFLKAWQYSDRRIVPGYINPNNVIVPELDFRESATIISLSGWEEYENIEDLLEPIYRNFYKKLVSHYKWISYQLKFDWFFDAFFEAFSHEEAYSLLSEAAKTELVERNPKFSAALTNYLYEHKNSFYKPIALDKAIFRYNEWALLNKEANEEAKEDTLLEIARLYKLSEYQEIVRFILYKETYFAEHSEEVRVVFAKLIEKLGSNKEQYASDLVELSELQSLLEKESDRGVFSRMVYPTIGRSKKIDVVISDSAQSDKVIIKTYFNITGETYTLREPKNPSEIGQLYRLFFVEKYPKVITEQDEYFVITDEAERVIGGLCYREIDDSSVLLDGTVIASTVKGRGLGTAMLEDFCQRMAARGVTAIKTHFIMPEFYLKRGFELHKKWGTLVRFLTPDSTRTISGNYCSLF